MGFYWRRGCSRGGEGKGGWSGVFLEEELDGGAYELGARLDRCIGLGA